MGRWRFAANHSIFFWSKCLKLEDHHMSILSILGHFRFAKFVLTDMLKRVSCMNNFIHFRCCLMIVFITMTTQEDKAQHHHFWHHQEFLLQMVLCWVCNNLLLPAALNFALHLEQQHRNKNGRFLAWFYLMIRIQGRILDFIEMLPSALLC